MYALTTRVKPDQRLSYVRRGFSSYEGLETAVSGRLATIVLKHT